MATPPVMPIVSPYTPELLEDVQKYIKEFIGNRKGLHVLEIGSGWSTIWFGLMTPQLSILSLEHHAEWWTEVTYTFELVTGRLSPVLLTRSGSFYSVLQDMKEKYFDLIYIDCEDEVRPVCTFASLPLLKEGGLLVLDDTHWDLWKECLSYVRTFNLIEKVIDGDHIRKDGSKKYHHTTLFLRSTNDRL